MTTPVLRIGHGNGHNKRSLVRYVRRAKADSFSCMEAHLLVGPLERIRGTRLTVPGEDVGDRRARSTSIVTSSRRENIGEHKTLVATAIPGAVNKWAPDRWEIESWYRHPLASLVGKRGVAHFALHPHATVKDRSLDHPIVKGYIGSLNAMFRRMREAKRAGMLVVATLDGQVTEGFDRAFGPRIQLAEPLGLQFRVEHIDWLLFPPEVALTRRLETRQLFDHTGFVATFTAAQIKENR